MEDFHLGDRVTWLPEKKTGIIINLLDYEGGDAGVIGIFMDNTREIRAVNANECLVYKPTPINWEEELQDYGDGVYSWPRSDCY